jgi:fatty acid desaturase
MPLNVDVNLPKSYTPVYPDRCVICGKASPGDTYRVTTRAIGSGTAVTTAGPKFTAEAPACPGCRDRMRRRVWSRIAANVLVILAGLAVGWRVLQGVHTSFANVILAAIVLVCLVPLIAWRVYFPLPFDITAFSDTVDYEFSDRAYAQEFAALNQGAKGD